MTKKSNLTGQRFGRLVVQRQAENAKSGGIRWECLCDCGNQATVFRSALGRHTNSCGCLMAENRKKVNITHGMSGSPEYVAFSSMRDRCNNRMTPLGHDTAAAEYKSSSEASMNWSPTSASGQAQSTPSTASTTMGITSLAMSGGRHIKSSATTVGTASSMSSTEFETTLMDGQKGSAFEGRVCSID